MVDGTNQETNKDLECEERSLTGSCAADSQLAAARSQLRFQSAAFSSSLQTATQTILDQNNKTAQEDKTTRKK